jgi:hypothetical protein
MQFLDQSLPRSERRILARSGSQGGGSEMSAIEAECVEAYVLALELPFEVF